MRGRAPRFTAGLAVVAAVCSAGATSTGAAGPTGNRPTCTLVNGVMSVDPGFWQPTLRREGHQIVTSYARGTVDCGPVPPTVTNVDRIELLGDEYDIDLRGGPFAPGLTPEADGSSEIETELVSGLLSGGPLGVTLGGDDDQITLGALARGGLGVNLNADEATPDVDLRIIPPARKKRISTRLILRGGRGTDRLDAGGGAGFAGPTRTRLLELRGGPGDDRITGGDRTEILIAGAGRDHVDGGAGSDLIGTRDSDRDTVDCGKGKDFLKLDRRDRSRHCELKRLPGDHHGDD